MSRNRIACLLVMPTFKPGDQPPEGYLEWHEWAEVQHKAGLRQVQCGVCSKWRYPQELSAETGSWNAQSRRGKVSLTYRICNQCSTKRRDSASRSQQDA